MYYWSIVHFNRGPIFHQTKSETALYLIHDSLHFLLPLSPLLLPLSFSLFTIKWPARWKDCMGFSYWKCWSSQYAQNLKLSNRCVSTLPHHCCCLPLPPPPPPGTTTISGAPLMTSRCTKPPTSSHRCSGSSGCPSPWRLPPALSPPLHWLVKILRLELSRERPPGSTPPTPLKAPPQVWRGIAITICDSRN